VVRQQRRVISPNFRASAPGVAGPGPRVLTYTAIEKGIKIAFRLISSATSASN
jgi:hypothetical protein